KRSESLERFNQQLLMGFLLFGGLYFAQGFLVPFFIASLIAMLLLPICNKLEKWGLNRVLAITICIMIFLGILTGLILLLINQIAGFNEDLPQLREKLQEHLVNLKTGIIEYTEISREQIQGIIQDGIEKGTSSLGQFLQGILTVTGGFFVDFLLILIYIGFFLAYREKIENFIVWVSPKEEKGKAEEVIKDSTRVAISYLAGILTVMTILAICNSIALSLLGIEHAIFFAILAAILNLIPFIGSFLGSLLPIFMALLTKDELWIPITIVIYFSFIQYIESYFLTPFIVGGKTKVNPLAEILALVIGGVIWGIAGLILFIPLMGLVKVLFDHVDKLKPYGYLIGRDETPSTSKAIDAIISWVKKSFGKK
ncbi:MAG: AI-2E family transporter, partial [Bacteroidetes bacterium]|nr:AI-2E family transporter [Bacteroidota bacterium]